MKINDSLRAIKLNDYKSGHRPTVLAIVLHDTAGSGTEGDAKYLANDPEHRGISVDYCILRDGTIYKLNPDLTRYSTNHAGRHTQLNADIKNADVNAHTIGIELSHKADPAKDHPEWPEAQIQSVADLCANLCAMFHLGRKDILTHAGIITDGSRSDPRNFPWTLFWGYFDAHRGEGPVPVQADGEAIYYNVKDGDTLWSIANMFHTTVEALKQLNNLNQPSNLINVGQRLLVKE